MRHGKYRRRSGDFIVPGSFVRNLRRYRAREYQWEKSEPWQEYCDRIESQMGEN